MPKLKNDLHERFCQEYIVDCHGTNAAIRAGVKKHQAGQQAWIWKQRQDVRRRLAELQVIVFDRVMLKAERILNELVRAGFSNIGDYLTFGPTGVTLRNMEDLSEDQLAAVAEVSQTIGKDNTGSIKFKLHDKINALKLLGQHLALFTQKIALEDLSLAQIASNMRKERLERQRSGHGRFAGTGSSGSPQASDN